MMLLNWTVVGRLGHELATINCPHVVSGAGDCDRAMGPCVGCRANFERIFIDYGEASPAEASAKPKRDGFSNIPNNAVTRVAL
jgi:hypothetical protein